MPHSFESGTAKGYVEPLQSRDGSPCRCRANLAHSRQSGPDSGLSLSHFQAKLFKILQVTPFLLGSGRFLPNPPLARVTCPRGRYSANMAHTGQSRPDSGLVSQVEVLSTSRGAPSSSRRGCTEISNTSRLQNSCGICLRYALSLLGPCFWYPSNIRCASQSL